jgi:hypothetical protein
MQFESEKPSHGTFTCFRQVPEYFVPLDAFVVAYGYFAGIHESDTGTFAKTNELKK